MVLAMARVAGAAEAAREVTSWCFAGESSRVIYLGLPHRRPTSYILRQVRFQPNTHVIVTYPQSTVQPLWTLQTRLARSSPCHSMQS